MKQMYRIAILVVFSLTLLLCAGDAFAQAAYVEGEALVVLEAPSTLAAAGSTAFETALSASADALAASVGARTLRTYSALAAASGRNVVLLRSDEMSTEELLTTLEGVPGVLGAAANRFRRLFREADDPMYTQLWGMEMVNAPEAWDVSVGDRAVFVAVIDTGIDYTHPDLAANMGRDKDGNVGRDVVAGTADPMDADGHGTHIAGTIGGVGNNGIGVVGVNWKVSLLGVKVFGNGDRTEDRHIIAGMDYVLDQKRRGLNIRAANVSLGDWEPPIADPEAHPMGIAVKAMSDAGIVVAIAAGNEWQDIDNPRGPGSDPALPNADYRGKLPYPAAFQFENTITVASVSRDGTRSDFSNHSANYVHIAAPGSNILSTFPDEAYKYSSGTSMATPFVAGSAALIAAAHPEESASRIRARILESATPNPRLAGRVKTGGHLNLAAAVGGRAPASGGGGCSASALSVSPSLLALLAPLALLFFVRRR